MKKVKMFKRIVSVILTAVLLAASIGNMPVLAAGNLAFSVGCDYGSGDIDTTDTALRACDYYAISGYTSRYTCNPNLTKKRASYSGTKLLESDIVFILGHGSKEGIHMNSLNQGGEYDFWVTTEDYKTNPILIESYNMNNVKLFVLAGCETAKGYSNITSAVYNDGAGASLGWEDEVLAVSMYAWVNRFNNCIALGYTVAGAISYANSFNYDDNRCKDNYLYGNGSQVLKRSSAASATANNMNMIERDNTVMRVSNASIETQNLNDNATIEQIIKSSYQDFFFDDFEIDIAEHDGGEVTLTVVEKVNGFFTQNAYVLFYKNGKITEIYDRTVNKNSVSAMRAQTLALQTINQQEAFSLAAEEISEEYTIVGQRGKAMFDVETGEKYYLVFTTISTEGGAKSVLSYKYVL